MQASPVPRSLIPVGAIMLVMSWSLPHGSATDAEVLRPRVPSDQLEEARTWTNPFPATEEHIERGKILFEGKAFCVTCHGRDGKGLSDVPGLRGKLPRNFTDRVWQAVRMDGELFWILKNGSPGTDMASFIPLILTEEEAWHVVLYVRSFGRP
jgi:mono/diheme cytochrome c family protein